MRHRTADGGARLVLALVLLKFDGLAVGELAHREAGPARWRARLKMPTAAAGHLLALRGGAGEPPAAVRLTGITARVTVAGAQLRARVCVCAQPAVFVLPWCLEACLRVLCKYFYM
jgi:hypothetical protein